MRERFLTHWRGILLSLVGIVATLWLAATGQLGLYIHPRYTVFTVVMAVIGAAAVIAAFMLVPIRSAAEDEEHDHHDGPPRRAAGWWTGASALLVVGTAVALLVLPPSTLTAATVEQRDMNGVVAAAPLADTATLVGGDQSSFTVKDWAGLLRSGGLGGALAGARPTLVGFVVPDPDDPENVFYVARFVVTCCAVDAQPVGVPVYSPDWQDDFATDDWVSVTGAFGPNDSATSLQPTALHPTEIVPAEQPSEPYVY